MKIIFDFSKGRRADQLAGGGPRERLRADLERCDHVRRLRGQVHRVDHGFDHGGHVVDAFAVLQHFAHRAAVGQHLVFSHVETCGEIEKIDKWGKRRLAYPIKKEHEGFYVLINFKSGSKVPAEITRIARITGGILRHLLAINKNEI